MPLPARVTAVRRTSIQLGLVRHEEDFGVLGMAIPRQCVMAVQLAEVAAEFNVLLAGYVLIPEKQYAVLQECMIDLAEECFAHLRHVHIANLCAERVRELP
jgi:hypothetical protein